MGLSVWRETSKKLTVYRVCYTPIETLIKRTALPCWEISGSVLFVMGRYVKEWKNLQLNSIGWFPSHVITCLM